MSIPHWNEAVLTIKLWVRPIPRKVKEWVPVLGVLVGALSLLVAARTYVRNQAVESDRWRAHLAVKPFRLDACVVLGAPFWVAPGVTVLPAPPPSAPPAQAPSATPPARQALCPLAPEAAPAARSTQTLHVMVRNSSFRPAAIVGASLRDAGGKDVSTDEGKYPRRFGMPLPVAPWEIKILVMEFDGADYGKAVKLALVDMDDRQVEIPLKDVRWHTWYDFPTE
jgi:hypothetical protein